VSSIPASLNEKTAIRGLREIRHDSQPSLGSGAPPLSEARTYRLNHPNGRGTDDFTGVGEWNH
jgi:hypothetical protein